MKIGITYNSPDKKNGIFSNGIGQNAIYFYDLLENMGFDVYFICEFGRNDPKYIFNDDKIYKFIIYDDILNSDFDIIFQLTIRLTLNVLLKLKETKTKVVIYKCGNDYIMEMEETLYSVVNGGTPQHSSLAGYNSLFDEMWIIPQHENTNYHYWKTLFRVDIKIVDPIWSPYYIEKMGNSFLYRNKGDRKKISIFEPNINMVKWFFPALLVCENAYREIDNKIDHVYVTNINSKETKFNKLMMNDIVKSLDLFIDKKMSIEDRYMSVHFMSEYSDIAVSHQWENPLNYLYLDLAWMGWPIVHNAHLCKDVGYYYEGFNYEQGGNVLLDVINNHDDNADEYLERNREIIDRYLPTNETVISNYYKLINDLIKK